MTGFWRGLFGTGDNPVLSAALNSPAPTFDVGDVDDPETRAAFGLPAIGAPNPTAPVSRIDRRSAIQCPAVKRCRDLIAGSIGSLPLDLYGPDKRSVRWAIFDQPEANTTRTTTMTKTVEDMLFEGVAWWRVTEFGWHGYPVKVKRIDPRTVTTNDGKVYVDGKHVPDSELIRFDSPNDPLLVAGARAIRTALHLDAAASRYADGAPPLDWFSPSDGTDPADDDEIVEVLNGWKTARQTRSTGYVPASLQYHQGGWNPEQLQLADARQHAVLELARVAGVDPEELGVSTTSRTYANSFDRRKAFLDFTLGGYLSALQDRLSMGDVSPRGYFARVNLDAFLRTDTKSRYEAYALGLEVGAIEKSEIRDLEDRPPLTTTTAPTPEESTVPAEQITAETFDTTTMDASAPAGSVFSVDVEKRTIRGLAVPYGVVGTKAGRKFVFSKGTILAPDPSRVKLWVGHDKDKAVGVAFELTDTDDGLEAAFKIARGAEGDKALSMAEDGVWDGLSIGPSEGSKYRNHDGVFHAVQIPIHEVSLTPAPVFGGARVRSVSFETDHEGRTTMETETEENGPDFSAVTDAIRDGFAGLAMPQRETVAAGDTVIVTEPLPYRFDGVPGEHSFSEDLRASASGDAEARQRLDTFMEDAFAVSTSNVTALNPTQNRPELYVPSLEYTRPLWELVSTGTVTDKTPFTVPKFSSASGLVGAHTEGVEPTPGSFSATNQTISPTPVSGKIEINREVWDAGGSPQADAIIWREMLNGYYEALEAKIATALDALSLTEINLAGAADSALVDGLTNVFTGLQFARGGNRFSALALDGKLFPALVNAADTTGRKLLPVVGPSNAQGQVTGSFDRVQIGNQTGRAAWALGDTVASHSYLFVPSSVWAWASAPKKFVFEYQVKSVDMAVWGYSATAVLRDSDVKRIDYTTADA